MLYALIKKPHYGRNLSFKTICLILCKENPEWTVCELDYETL